MNTHDKHFFDKVSFGVVFLYRRIIQVFYHRCIYKTIISITCYFHARNILQTYKSF